MFDFLLVKRKRKENQLKIWKTERDWEKMKWNQFSHWKISSLWQLSHWLTANRERKRGKDCRHSFPSWKFHSEVADNFGDLLPRKWAKEKQKLKHLSWLERKKRKGIEKKGSHNGGSLQLINISPKPLRNWTCQMAHPSVVKELTWSPTTGILCLIEKWARGKKERKGGKEWRKEREIIQHIGQLKSGMGTDGSFPR